MLWNPALFLRALPLLGVLALAGGLRIYALDFQSLWNDELSTMGRILSGPGEEDFWEKVHKDVHPPGYLCFLWFWTNLFGNSEFSLRLPSALAGTLAVWGVYRLGRDLFDRNAGLCGASLAAVSPFLIEYSQEARSFSIAAWLSIECACCLVRLGLKSGEKLLHWEHVAVCAVVTAAGAYTHYMGLLAVGALHSLFLVWVLIQAREKCVAAVSSIGLAVLLYVPWIPGFLDHLERGGLKWLRQPKFSDLLAIDQVALPGIVLLFVALLAAFRRERHVPGGAAEERRMTLGAALLVAWVALMIAGSYVKSLDGNSIFLPRNLIVVSPAIFVCLGCAVGRGARIPQFLGVGAVCAFLLYALVEERAYYTTVKKQQFREASALGHEWASREPRTDVVSYSWSPSYFDYYFEKMGSEVRVSGHTSNRNRLAKVVQSRFKKGATKVVVLAGHKRISGAERRVLSRFRRVRAKSLKGADVLLLEQKKKAPKKRRRR